ncbi:PAS modulated sigma54 specific transcriptinal regulator, Fis family [Desulfosarcina variabilis str. Montpellier]|uniref:sigma 54-interacting transcriptional regulator n=1 Tax=Desulfosarcina variabilis TaxID=2300 RepID=UPI003AFA7842
MTVTKRYGTILFLLVTIYALVPSSLQAESARIVHVGAYDYKPLIFRDGTGNFKGVYPDLLNAIATQENWQINYIEGSWLDCIERLETGQIDLLPAIAWSIDRASRYRFNNETVLTNWGQLYTRQGLDIKSITDLNDRKIAVYRKGIFSDALMKLIRDLGMECEFVAVEDYDTIFQLVEDGRVDAGVSNNIFGLLHAQNYRIKKSTIIFMPTELRFAAPKRSSPELMHAIDAHLGRFKTDKDSVFHQSMHRWEMNRWAMTADQKRMSRWIVTALVTALGIAALLFFASMILRRQVRRKALELVQSGQALGREIEARQSAGEALKEKDRMLSTLMENLPGAVYRCHADLDRTIVFVSKGVEFLLGYPSDDFGLQRIASLRELVHPEDVKMVTEGLRASIERKVPYRLMYRMKTRSGAYRWVGDQGAGVARDVEEFSAFEGFLSDITQQQETELAILQQNEKLREEMKDRFRFGGIIGKSAAMQEVYGMIVKAGASEDPVIITGESGTGKELAARAIHELSRRTKNTFVPVNCGAIPENLLESEFFGHVKGAFTGADVPKAGLLDAADGGTLFLDEIGDIAMALQVKLLRAIEGGGYTPVGGTQVKQSDFRIVAATNRNLDDLVKQGRFREDFYYRLHVIPVQLPPLRRRREDIPLLVDHFLEKYEDETIPPFTGNIMEALMGHSWPGNVRELQNTVHRYVALGRLDFAGKKGAPAFRPERDGNYTDPTETTDLRTALDRFEKRYIERLLNEHNWHRGKVADILQINRKTLFSKIKSHRIHQPKK